MTDDPDEPYSPVDLSIGVQARVNWRALVIRLERAGMRHIDIAAAAGRSERWVGQLKSGEIREPPYSVGVILREMDSRETQDLSVR